MIVRKSRNPAPSVNVPAGGGVAQSPKVNVRSGAARATGRKNAQRKNAQYLFEAARKAAIESDLAQYMHLECGHMVTREAAILFSVFAPSIKDVYCHICDEYKRLKRRHESEPYPDNPLF